MNQHQRLLVPLLLLGLGVTACGKQEPEVPAVSFSKDIQPIFNANCVECHKPGGMGMEASGLDLESYAGIMKGTKFGPVINAGSSVSSTLIVLVTGRADKSLKMPHGDRKPLSDDNIQTLKHWIDQGAKNN